MVEEENNKECTCEDKKLCCKMQQAGLRSIAKRLERCTTSYDENDVATELHNLRSVLESYSCSPYKCLLSRVDYLLEGGVQHTSIFYNHLTMTGVEQLRTLAAEIQALIGDQ